MTNKKIDSIKVIKTLKPKPKRPVLVDAVCRLARANKPRKQRVSKETRRSSRDIFSFLRFRFFLAAASGVFLFAAFVAGSYFMWSTQKTLADEPAAAPAGLAGQIPSAEAVAGAAVLGPIEKVPNEVLFNLTIGQLENYLQEALKTSEMKEAEKIALRTEALRQYLSDKKSPLVGIADTLAELKHWKMVLAISNSESSLGKRCYNNNCSGIGVEPGHPLWRDYPSKRAWAQDLDKLIEKRYKDWTLEKMNGVYNKPGSQNWLLAAKQVLEALQERGIE